MREGSRTAQVLGSVSFTFRFQRQEIPLGLISGHFAYYSVPFHHQAFYNVPPVSYSTPSTTSSAQ